MSVYIIAQLKFTRRELYDRYQSRFMGVFKKFRGKLLAADAHPVVLEGEWPRDKAPPRRNSRILPNIRRYRWIEKRAPTPLCSR